MRACPKCGTKYPDEVTFCSKDGTQLSDLDKVTQSLAREEGTVMGSYRLIKLLAEGGMGRVYLAEHTRLGRKVALKLLRSEYSSNAPAIKRFFREARTVNDINHENIIEITDFFEKEGGDNFYIMELLKGRSLTEVLKEEGALPVPRTIDIALQVCRALIAVHAAGVIHRDLKPDNIFLTERGSQKDFVKLLDFGVAKLLDVQDGMPVHQTGMGAILGTPQYMSPEQAGAKPVDRRTDIYSLGVILYEMVTGRVPLNAETYGEMVIKHLTVTPPSPTELRDLPQGIPGELEDLIMQCLEKNPNKRPQDMEEIARRLELVGRAESLELEVLDLATPRRRRRARIAVLFVILLGCAVVGFILVANLGGEQPRPQPHPEVALVPEDVGEVIPLEPIELAEVEISFDSKPQGAEVYRQGNPEPLGTTPFSATFDPESEPESFEFRLKDHQAVQQKVSLQENTRIAVTMAKIKKPPKATRGKKKKRKKRKKVETKGQEKPEEKKPEEKKPPGEEDASGTIDPFAEDKRSTKAPGCNMRVYQGNWPKRD
jgi:serine/threonine protein kinase